MANEMVELSLLTFDKGGLLSKICFATESKKHMKLIPILIIVMLLSGCKSGRFNLYDYLTVEPTVTELTGSYTLKASDSSASPLTEMGYDDVNCRINLNADGTFTASRLPSCLLHGWDERRYPFTGGLYSISGEWVIIKKISVDEVKLSITTISEHTSLIISNPKLSAERKPPKTLEVALVKGNPIDLGFKIYNGDFIPIKLAKIKTDEELQR